MKIQLITSVAIAACFTLNSYSNEEPAEDRVPLETELPISVRIGPTKSVRGVPNLAPETKSFPKFLVPKDATIISKGKPVTSSDLFPIIGSLELITDGEKDTREGHYVELLDGLQWVQIDLEKPTPIYAILVWHFHAQKRVYNDVVVQVSNDSEFEKGVTTLYNNDYDNSSKLGKGSDQPYIETHFGLLVDGKATKAQYVRLYSKGSNSNELNYYIEVEVWGKE